MTTTESVFDKLAHPGARPRLSVLTPYYHYDPCPLIELLAREAADLNGAVELVLLDDGGGDAALNARVQACLAQSAMPARLVVLSANQGRARGRNLLFSHARCDYGLFLDCDMAPDSPDFLRIWLDLLEAERPVAAFGGFSLNQIRPKDDQQLHYALQIRGECINAQMRRRAPEKYVYTSNLLVHRSALAGEPFDEGFTGWGWEDVEWGMRVAQRWGVTHLDNTATHMGLDAAPALLAKYEQSGVNFARILQKHPQVVRDYPSYRVSRLFRRLPARAIWRPWLKAVALSAAPLSLRVLCAKLYRAALYAEARG